MKLANKLIAYFIISAILYCSTSILVNGTNNNTTNHGNSVYKKQDLEKNDSSSDYNQSTYSSENSAQKTKNKVSSSNSSDTKKYKSSSESSNQSNDDYKSSSKNTNSNNESSLLPKTKNDSSNETNKNEWNIVLSDNNDDEDFGFIKNKKSNDNSQWLKTLSIILLVLSGIGFTYIIIGLGIRKSQKSRMNYRRLHRN